MNRYLLIWSVCTFVESRVQEEILMEELVCQTDRADETHDEWVYGYIRELLDQ